MVQGARGARGALGARVRAALDPRVRSAPKAQRWQGGFTLIEMLIVMVLIVLLASVVLALPVLTKSVRESQPTSSVTAAAPLNGKSFAMSQRSPEVGLSTEKITFTVHAPGATAGVVRTFSMLNRKYCVALQLWASAAAGSAAIRTMA